MESVAVVGAGITGLTAAFHLKRRGIPVTVYEGSHRPGGVIQTHQCGGYLAEHGPTTLLEGSPDLDQLIADTGLSDVRVWAGAGARHRYVVRDGQPVAVPSSPLAILTSSFLSPKGKLRLCLEPLVPRRSGEHEESLAEFTRRRLGQEFLDYAVNPFVAGVFAGDPERLSARYSFPALVALEREHGSLLRGHIRQARARRKAGAPRRAGRRVYSFSAGMQMLPDSLHQHLAAETLLDTKVCAVRPIDTGWCVTSWRGSREHSAVLVAGAAHQLARIGFETRDSGLFECFGEVSHPPVTVLTLGFRRAAVSHPLDGFGLLVPQAEGFNILGVLFASSLFAHRAPEDRVALTVYVGGARAPTHALASDHDLMGSIMPALRTLLSVRGEPDFMYRVTHARAIPQYELGHERVVQATDAVEARQPGLFLAGTYRGGVAVGDAVTGACRAAERVERFLQARRGQFA